MLPLFNGVKMEVIYSSEMLVTTYDSTRVIIQKTVSDIFAAMTTSNLR
jgi:hypothetical protein